MYSYHALSHLATLKKQLKARGQKQELKSIKAMSRVDQFEKVRSMLHEAYEKQPNYRTMLDQSGTLQIVDAECAWIRNPSIVHLELEVFEALRQLGIDSLLQQRDAGISSRELFEGLLRALEPLKNHPLIIQPINAGAPTKESLLLAICPDSRVDHPLFIAVENRIQDDHSIEDDWLLHVAQEQDDQLAFMAMLSKIMPTQTHYGEPMLIQSLDRYRDTLDGGVAPTEALNQQHLSFNLAVFYLGYSLYLNSYPDALQVGLPETLKLSSLKHFPKKTQFGNLVLTKQPVEEARDHTAKTTFMRRPHLRVLAHPRYKRTDSGLPKVVMVKAATVRIAQNQVDYTLGAGTDSGN